MSENLEIELFENIIKLLLFTCLSRKYKKNRSAG